MTNDGNLESIAVSASPPYSPQQGISYDNAIEGVLFLSAALVAAWFWRDYRRKNPKLDYQPSIPPKQKIIAEIEDVSTFVSRAYPSLKRRPKPDVPTYVRSFYDSQRSLRIVPETLEQRNNWESLYSYASQLREELYPKRKLVTRWSVRRKLDDEQSQASQTMIAFNEQFAKIMQPSNPKGS